MGVQLCVAVDVKKNGHALIGGHGTQNRKLEKNTVMSLANGIPIIHEWLSP